jgi:hypothetical protein
MAAGARKLAVVPSNQPANRYGPTVTVRCLYALFARIPSLANRMMRNEMASSRPSGPMLDPIPCERCSDSSFCHGHLIPRRPLRRTLAMFGRPGDDCCIPSPDCRLARRVLGGVRCAIQPATPTERALTTAVSTIGPVARPAPSRATWRWPGSWRHEPPMMTTCAPLRACWNGRGRIERAARRHRSKPVTLPVLRPDRLDGLNSGLALAAPHGLECLPDANSRPGPVQLIQ